MLYVLLCEQSTNYLNNLNQKFECCGNKGPSDWHNMPASCCVQNTDFVNSTCEESYTSGCFDPIHQIVIESIMTIGSAALVFAVVAVVQV